MHDFAVQIINEYGYVGVFLLITIENLFPPIPSELILTFGGFMTTITTMNFWGVVLSATLGSVVGAIILYSLGRVLSVDRLERFFDSKYGKILHLRKTDVRRAGKWFVKRGNLAVFFGRFVAIIRSLVSIPAGIAKMRISVFLVLTFCGTFIWNVVLVYLGKLAGDAWETVASYVDYYSLIIILVLLAVAFIIGFKFLKRRFFTKDNSKESEPEDEQ